MIIVYVTHESEEAARHVVDHLLDKRLIACANFFPIESDFVWKGERKCENEIVTLLKTRNELWEVLRAEIEKVHPYETPCIMRFDVEANDAYEQWIRAQTSDEKTTGSSEQTAAK